jgi:WD40 repeat protein/predicted Ser/Thr protein kinase
MEKPNLVCAVCHTELSAKATEGLCPRCLIERALAPEATIDLQIAGGEPHLSIPSTPFTGTRLRYFGDYELLEEIARGGMGVVFKARQIHLNRIVALKLINSGALASEGIVKRFKAEAEAAAILNHPNVVPIHEIGEVQGQHYFSMGLVEGPNLDEYLGSKPLPTRRAAELIVTLAGAVQYAHQLGILHRDLKPSNILIDKEEVPYLVDFGLAKLVEKDSTLTHTNAIMGTPSYMAPEQARGETKRVTTAVDVYGLGVLLYVCLTGHPPFAGGTSYETIRQVLEQEPRPPSEWNPLVDRDLETICLKCLEKEPDCRYQTAAAVEADLCRWLNCEPVAARPSSSTYRFQKWVQRRPAIAALSGTVLFLLITIAVGSTIAAIGLKKEAAATKAANEESKAKLWESYVAHARASRLSGQPGHRFDSLGLLKKASEIKSANELRNEAIAAMANADMRPVRSFNVGREGETVLDVDLTITRYARSTKDGTVTIHRVEDDSIVTTLKSEGKSLDLFPGCSWTKRHFIGNYSDRTIRVWDILESRLLMTMEGDRTAADGAGNRLAVGRQPNELLIYDLRTLSLERSVTLPIEPSWLAFSEDGTRLAISSELHKTVVIIDIETGKIVRRLEHPTIVRQISWGARENLACPLQTGEIYVWDIESGRREMTLEGHGPNIITLACAPKTDFLISSGWDRTARIWNCATGKLLLRYPVEGAVHVSPAGDKLGVVGFGRNSLQVFDLALPEVSRSRPFGRQGNGEEGGYFFPDTALFALTYDTSLCIFDAQTRKILAGIAGFGTLYSRISPDGQSLVIETDKGLFLWPIRRINNNEMVIGPARKISTTRPDWADFDQNGEYILIRERNRLKLFSIKHLRIEKEFPLYQKSLSRFDVLLRNNQPTRAGGVIYFSSDNLHVVIAESKGYSVRDTGSWTEVGSISLPFDETKCGGVTLAPQCGVGVVREKDNIMHLVSFPTMESLATLIPAPSGERVCVLLSADAKMLAGFSTTGDLAVYNLDSLWHSLDHYGLAWPDRQLRRASKAVSPAPKSIEIVPGEYPTEGK